nr:armadillo repeat-containing protein 7-like isoform X2 [Lytechinus pictus]
MFQSRDRLEARTPLQHGIGRLQHLQNLMIEFQQTEDDGCREQVLANLANFAYDPINYEYLRQLNAVDLFLDTLTEPSERLVEFGIGGLCNLVLDKENKAHILANDGVSMVKDCLSSPNEEIVLSAITTLMYLMTPASKQGLLYSRATPNGRVTVIDHRFSCRDTSTTRTQAGDKMKRYHCHRPQVQL